jgi:hypothetical protein
MQQQGMSNNNIVAIPSHFSTELFLASEGELEDYTCKICLQIPQQFPVVCCEHFVCIECGEKAAQSNAKYTCVNRCGKDIDISIMKTVFNPKLKKDILQMKRKCKAHKEGCTAIFTMGHDFRLLLEHERTCSYLNTAECDQCWEDEYQERHAIIEMKDETTYSSAPPSLKRARNGFRRKNTSSSSSSFPSIRRKMFPSEVKFHQESECVGRFVECEVCDLQVICRDQKNHFSTPMHIRCKLWMERFTNNCVELAIRKCYQDSSYSDNCMKQIVTNHMDQLASQFSSKIKVTYHSTVESTFYIQIYKHICSSFMFE